MSYVISAILTPVLIGVSSHFLSKYDDDKKIEKDKTNLILGIVFAILSIASFLWLLMNANEARKVLKNQNELSGMYDLVAFNFAIVIALMICVPLLANYNVKQKQEPLIASSATLVILIFLFGFSFYKIREEKIKYT